MAITMQIPVLFSKKASTPDNELQLIREMGITNVDLNFDYETCNYDDLSAVLEHLKQFGLEAGNLSCMPLQKNKIIDLGWDTRDAEIYKYNDLIRLAHKVNVPIVSVAWQPNGILRTGRKEFKSAHGGITGYVDMEEISKRENANDRLYTVDEIWENFAYFLKKTLPVAEAEGVRMALHPNDPPVEYLAGVGSLIYRTEDYNRAFALANESPALAMKMCIGCWLEGGSAFGDLMADIEDFCKRDKIVVVHFRNVTSTIPYFEEVLAEDGYADMYAIMKKFVECGYDGLMSVDHVFSPHEKDNPNRTVGYCYPTGYAKGLLHAAEAEAGKH